MVAAENVKLLDNQLVRLAVELLTKNAKTKIKRESNNLNLNAARYLAAF